MEKLVKTAIKSIPYILLILSVVAVFYLGDKVNMTIESWIYVIALSFIASFTYTFIGQTWEEVKNDINN